MRIGIVTGEYPPMQGGVGAYSRILAQTFAQQGHQIFVFSSESTQNLDEDVSLTNKVKRWNPASIWAIRQWANSRQIDVINLQFQTASFQMSPFIHFLPQLVRNVPVVTTFHDLRYPYLFPKAGRLRDWIVMHLARTSAGVIVTNHEDLQRVAHLRHSTLIPIGSNILTSLDADFNRNDWRARAGARERDFLIAYFGFINRSKGIDTLLHSVAALHTDGFPVKLVMIGGRTGSSDPTNAAFAAEIDALIAKLNLTADVCWTGFVDEETVSAYLEASDVVALPFEDGASYRRGSLMAAIHHGCAIITTAPSVAIPTFLDGKNMLLVSPSDVSALSGAIGRLIQSPDLQEKLRCGAKELDRQFDWTQIAHDCAAFFERVIQEKA
jgi:glycosyltransferase involved in cell wall biosynthesis